jgi:ParB family chromosome partitioning protein
VAHLLTEEVRRLLRDIPLDQIRPNPAQPRQYFAGISELAQSLIDYGQLTPVLLRRRNGFYQIVHGERRYRAAKQAGLPTLRAEVRELTDEEAFQIALVENLQRDDLGAVEEARAFERLQRQGMTQEAIGRLVGRSQQHVAARLSLLNLPDDIQRLITIRKVTPSMGAILATVSDVEKQRLLAQRLTNEELTVRELREAKREIERQNTLRSPEPLPTDRLQQVLTLSLQTQGKMERSRISGREWADYATTVWSDHGLPPFDDSVDHPARFSGVIPWRLIKLFSFVDDVVLDPMVGGGTTLYQAWRLERFSIGCDVNAAYLSQIQEELEDPRGDELHKPLVQLGDARDLSFLPDESIHLCITHPPYWNVVPFGGEAQDLSHIGTYDGFLREMERVFEAVRRVLVKDRVFAVVTGDLCRTVDGSGRVLPLHADYIHIAERAGFNLWDLYLWQLNIPSGRTSVPGSFPFPHKVRAKFAHAYILIFRRR